MAGNTTTQNPKDTLGRGLSLHTVVTTPECYAQAQSIANNTSLNLRDKNPFTYLDRGGCGIVYDIPNELSVAKLLIQRPDPNYQSMLWNDLVMHRRARTAFTRLGMVDCQIPAVRTYISGNEDTWWQEHGHRFPTDAQRSHVLITERILPLPRGLRDALIDRFCPPKAISAARSDARNEACMVQLHFGARSRTASTLNRFFTLKNFKLFLNMAEDLALDCPRMARTMGSALAAMHWKACIDAKDVEYVLATTPILLGAQIETQRDPHTLEELQAMSPDSSLDATSLPRRNFNEREVTMWVLDFNQCREISRTEQDIPKMVEAFYWGNAHLPRPATQGAEGHAIWDAFREEYLRFSMTVIDGLGLDAEVVAQMRLAPHKFIEAVIAEMQRREAGRQ